MALKDVGRSDCPTRQPGQLKCGILPNGCTKWCSTPKNEAGGTTPTGKTRMTGRSGKYSAPGGGSVSQGGQGNNPTY
tara:strand:- start:400 stop:630 length:231 start_codon:yes stop_codon:yes gene_type:complete